MRKLQALKRAVNSLAVEPDRSLIIVGDRDAESSSRSKRPMFRVDENLNMKVVAPLKYWSGSHVEAYILWNGFKLNPLYEKGFLRLGCYLCFALRTGWEIQVLEKLRYFDKIALRRSEQSPIIKKFLNYKYSAGAGSGFGSEA